MTCSGATTGAQSTVQVNIEPSTSRVAVRARSKEAGSQAVEFSLILLPLLAFVFLIIDVSWICFASASLQHAVQIGVRAAVSGYVPDSAKGKGQDAYIRSAVQQNAMGFIGDDPKSLDKIRIDYYSRSNLSKPLGNGSGTNVGGNVVQVSISNVRISTLGPIMGPDWAELNLGATASDVMESSPDGIPPAR
jgi:TadE-like protein